MATWLPYGAFNYLHSDYVSETARQIQGRIAIVGLPGAGKKTLFNSLWGWDAILDSDETVRNFGLFSLIDLPLDPYDAASVLYHLENADLILYLLDGGKELTAECFNWIARLRSVEATLMVILTHADEMPKEMLPQCVKELEARLARPVLPLSATSRDDIQEKLIPVILKVCPHLAVSLANEIPALRAQVARHIVLQGVIDCMTAGSDMGIANDSVAYMNVQLRMIRQIAAVYGYKHREHFGERSRVSQLLCWVMHFVPPTTAQLKKLEAWLQGDQRLHGIVSAGTTLVIGYLAILAYSGHLPRWLQRFAPIVGGHNDTNGTGSV